MRGIKSNLLQAFLAVIVGLAFGTCALLVLNDYVVRQYKTLSDTMIAEYRLVDSLSGLIAAYNTRVISTSSDEGRADEELIKAKQEIARLTSYLDKAITDTPTKVSYIGLKNSIEVVTTTIDQSLQDVARGDIESFTADYYEANKQYQFVRDNGTTLIFDQLKHASSILDAMNRTYRWSQILGMVTLLAIILACVAYVTKFSAKLTAPILRLERLAQEIAAGNLDVRVDKDLLAKKDELGSLARSFQNMSAEISKATAQVRQSQEELKRRADDLQRMNNLMVGRELKMVEMKRELDRLKPS